eukprot:6202298-Pleurochrysis_carterae.AAC.1
MTYGQSGFQMTLCQSVPGTTLACVEKPFRKFKEAQKCQRLHVHVALAQRFLKCLESCPARAAPNPAKL